MIAWSSSVRTLERGFFGPIRSSEVDSRPFHLATVLRSKPCRPARTVFVSSLAWIARRTFGVVLAEPCARLGGSRPRSRVNRVSPETSLAKNRHGPEGSWVRPAGKADPRDHRPREAEPSLTSRDARV